MTRKLINILGAARSGTTMLDLMMGNDPKSFSMGEVSALFRPYRKHHFSIDCNCGNPQCPYWTKLIKLKDKELFANAFEILDVEYIIDSSKNLPWVMDSLDALKNKQDIRIINFLLYKPFLSYSYSIWKRGNTIEAALNQYKVYYKRFFESGLGTYAVSFEELVNHPNETLQGLCEITGQEFSEDRKAFWKKEHHHLFGSAGTREQARKGESNIRRREEFPEEFKVIIPNIQRLIERDKSLKNILNRLEELDFKKRDNDSEQNQLSLIKPGWYYYIKNKNKWKSKFPDVSF